MGRKEGKDCRMKLRRQRRLGKSITKGKVIFMGWEESVKVRREELTVGLDCLESMH